MSVRIIQGDCRAVLPAIEAASFDCIVTSPPYWGLRDYGVEAQVGLEPTLDAYVETMVGVGRELKRVLKPNGTFWLNLGDCYRTSPPGNKPGTMKSCSGLPNSAANLERRRSEYGVKEFGALKPKDLCGVPWRVAFALQADGWWLRSAIIWHKPNPMPESVTDRPTSAYEMVFLLTKAERYFYDADAIAEDGVAREKYFGSDTYSKGSGRNDSGSYNNDLCLKRNARNVWTISTQPFKGSHFATMPPDLAERCIKAGCPPGGHVLDPFGGAGTTGLVADRLCRNATLIELNPAYESMAAARISDDLPICLHRKSERTNALFRTTRTH